MPQQTLLKRPVHPRGLVSPDLRTTFGQSKRVRLENQLIKLRDLSPLIRNSNVTTDALEAKAGPQALIDLGDGVKTMWFEGIQATGFPANNGMTAFMKATAPTWQGPWTVSPTTRVLDAGDTTTWEYYEFSPSFVVRYGGNLVCMAHGGNNTGPAVGGPLRPMGRAISTDGYLGLSWTKDPNNPLMTCGPSGSWDDVQTGNDFKFALQPDGSVGSAAGEKWAVFRGRKSGQTDGYVGRASVSNDYATITKNGQVISTAPSWATGGITSGTPFYDHGGRAHMFAPDGPNGIGYYYSDDDGWTWVAGNAGNRVAAPSGIAGAYDKNSTGDVVQGWPDGDVIFLTHGVDNISDYTGTGGTPLRAMCAAITPFRKAVPDRKGKFHLGASRTALATVPGLLNKTTYTMMGRFRAYRVDRTAQPRTIYDEWAAFNKEVFVRIESNTSLGGTTDGGKFHFWHRSPSGIVSLLTTGTYDDALPHKWMVIRTAAAAFEVWIDGAQILTSSVNPATDATATTAYFGNANPGSSTNDQPSNFTNADVCIVTNYAATWAEASAYMDTRALLGGGTVVFDSSINGADLGDVALVEAAGLAIVSGSGSAAGAGAASAVGQSTALATGSATGTGAATAAGQALAIAVGSAAGVGAASGAAATGTSSGAAAGVGSASGVGQALALSTGSAAGVGSATAVGAANDNSTGSATGVGAASATGASLAIATGSASGVGAATGVAPGGASVGSASGTGSATAVGGSLAIATGSAAGTSTASATGKVLFTGVALSAGVGVAVGAGRSIALAVGISAGVGSAVGTNLVPFTPAAASRTRSVERQQRVGKVSR